MITPEQVLEAVEVYLNDMEEISSKRCELARLEIEAWNKLRDSLEWYDIPWH